MVADGAVCTQVQEAGPRADLYGSPESPSAATVFVLWCAGADRELARRLIRAASQRAGVSAPAEGSIRVINHCRSCGSSDHGRPVLLQGAGLRTSHVSISYAEDLTVVALTGLGPVGVDVERRDAASFPGFDGVAAHAREESRNARTRTITWVRKESLLKATGHGLTVDPRLVQISRPDEPPALIAWSAADPPRGPVWILDVEIAGGYSAAVAVLAPARPVLLVRRADLGARPG